MLLSEESLTNSECGIVVSMSVRRRLPRPLSLWSKEGCWKHLKILRCACDFYQLTDLARPIAESTTITMSIPFNLWTSSDSVYSKWTKSDSAVFDCFSRRNQIMRYITVEDLSFYYDKEPVLEHINYCVDSENLLPWLGKMEQLRRRSSRPSLGILQPRIGKVAISKTNTQGENWE